MFSAVSAAKTFEESLFVCCILHDRTVLEFIIASLKGALPARQGTGPREYIIIISNFTRWAIWLPKRETAILQFGRTDAIGSRELILCTARLPLDWTLRPSPPPAGHCRVRPHARGQTHVRTRHPSLDTASPTHPGLSGVRPHAHGQTNVRIRTDGRTHTDARTHTAPMGSFLSGAPRELYPTITERQFENDKLKENVTCNATRSAPPPGNAAVAYFLSDLHRVPVECKAQKACRTSFLCTAFLPQR